MPQKVKNGRCCYILMGIVYKDCRYTFFLRNGLFRFCINFLTLEMKTRNTIYGWHKLVNEFDFNDHLITLFYFECQSKNFYSIPSKSVSDLVRHKNKEQST